MNKSIKIFKISLTQDTKEYTRSYSILIWFGERIVQNDEYRKSIPNTWKEITFTLHDRVLRKPSLFVIKVINNHYIILITVWRLMGKEIFFCTVSWLVQRLCSNTVILLVLKNASLFLRPDIFVLPFIESCQWISYQPLINKKQKKNIQILTSLLTVAKNAVVNINLMLLGFFNDNQWTYLKPPKPLNNALFLVTLTATTSKSQENKIYNFKWF